MSTAKSIDTAAPARIVAVEDRPFWDAIDRGEFHLARCRCGTWYSRTQACLACGAGADALTWQAASGDGTVRTFVVFDKPYHPYFAERLPYVVGIVTLREGPEILTNVIDCAIDAVHVGMPVRVVTTLRDGQAIHQASARV